MSMSRHEATLDWVEQETGEPWGHLCAGGHHWVPIDPDSLTLVNGHPATFEECSVCGATGFHWIPQERTSA